PGVRADGAAARTCGGAPSGPGTAPLRRDDERRHGDICLRIAEHHAGARLEPLELGETPLPRFGCDDERLEAALLLAGTCCINETHARIGWAHLGSDALDHDLRVALGACLPRLVPSPRIPLASREESVDPRSRPSPPRNAPRQGSRR